MKYVAALDVGTTTVRCHILDENAVTLAASTEKVQLIYPKAGYVEIDPDHLWTLIRKVIQDAVHESRVEPKSIACLGISTQRCTFTTWNLHTGKNYHRLITWKDLRAASLVKEWNNSLTMKVVRAGSFLLYTTSRSKKFLATSVFTFMNTQVTMRLIWALQNVPGLREAADSGKAVFGGVDSWLLYKLTGKHVSDVSSASATGMFDPFTMQWAGWLFRLPSKIFPEVVDSAGNFGVTPIDLFGAEVPIACSMADQAASLFGLGCFQPGDLKITMGTGSFLNVNTGTQPHATMTGLYPVVGWRIGSELTYVVEGASNDTGITVEWARSIGIVNEVSETSDLAFSVENSDGVYFVPAFSGLQAPINNAGAAAGFIGVKPTTGKAHLVRALLESIVFRIVLHFYSLDNETKYKYKKIRVDGGVSKNDFILQLLADLTGLEVERTTSSEMSILGVGFIAGLQCGVWKNREELQKFRQVEKLFKPNEENGLRYQTVIREWKRAVDRFKDWY